MNENNNISGGNDNNITLPEQAEIEQILQNVKQLYVWRGSIPERKEKFIFLHEQLSKLFNNKTVLCFGYMDEQSEKIGGSSGYSMFIPPPVKTIILAGKLSLITYLNLFGRSIGLKPADSQIWAKNTFNKVFPVSSRNLIEINGMVIKQTDILPNNDPNNDPLTDGIGDI